MEQVHIAQDGEERLTMATLICPEAGGPTVPAREVRSLGESSARTLAQGSTTKVISFSVEVEIHEEKVFAHLDEEKERDTGTSVLDTGVTNHMSGCQVVFTKFDTVMLGIVCFSDDSVAQIECCGTIVFVCKNGESRSFNGVYFIPRLTTNIVSVGQLDEIGYKIDINMNVMKI
jgi:hypothetical protein